MQTGLKKKAAAIRRTPAIINANKKGSFYAALSQELTSKNEIIKN
jgi:hypothetical protein